ncbi:hypothetical protein RJ639_031081 [Escallonia herrerae]|uniref:Uncharacterized protein n=1 Tax=Escallonia herrerae TaxID=1293975 RepID=A0AA89BDE0_9ASTE|nr:hypothetical protein RJ639_031081 [Escallonia herrerae]
MEYIISLIQRGVAEHLENALLTSRLLQTDVSKAFSKSSATPLRIKEIIYSIKNASQGNVIGPPPGSPNSSSDIFNSCLKTSWFRYTRGITNRLPSMISTKTLARIVRKWQNLVAIRRKRILLARNVKNVKEDSFGTLSLADKCHFVVYSNDGRRFMIPLVYLNNKVLRQLFTKSEEEFGLPGDGPITLPCDAFLMEYIISLIRRGVAEDLEKALLASVFRSHCRSSSSLHQGQSSQQLLQDRMINTKTLARMVRKWQSLVAIRRKRISLPRNTINVEESCSGTQLLADKGHFVVYSDDGRRFVIPLVYLNNEVLRQLLTMSEEVFGLPGDGPITLPCDAFWVEYIVSLIQRGVAEHLEKALLTSVSGSRCTSSSSLHQGQSSQQLFGLDVSVETSVAPRILDIFVRPTQVELCPKEYKMLIFVHSTSTGKIGKPSCGGETRD